MTSTLEIEVDQLFKELVDPSIRFVFYETAHTDLIRADDTLLLKSAVSGGDTVVLCPREDEDTVILKLADWFAEMGRKVSRRLIGKTTLYATESGKYWINPKAVPKSLNNLFVVGAHHIPEAPPFVKDLFSSSEKFLGSFVRGACSGRFTELGHWFFDLLRRDHLGDLRCVTVRQLPISLINSPTLLQGSVDTRRRDYRRNMLLIDEPIPATPFRVFARQRLRIQTDKGPEFLTSEQQKEAEEQCGPHWATGKFGVPVVTYTASQLQKKYLAIKRYARSKGYNRFVLIKYRRGGFTTTEQGISYQTIAEIPRSQVATLAHTRNSTQRIFKIVERYKDNDPEKPRLIADNKSSLELANGSVFFIGTAGGQGGFRGDTLQRYHLSEGAWCCAGPNQYEDVSNLVAALNGAASQGEGVIETTPNGLDWVARTYKEAKVGANDYYPIFLPWYKDRSNVAKPGTYSVEELKDTLTDSEKKAIRDFDLNWAQLAFRRKMQREYKHLFPQEFPEDDVSCFITTGTPYFNPERTLELIEAGFPEPLLELPHPDGYKRIWEPPVEGRRYVVGVDTSEGIPGCDMNGGAVYDVVTGNQVAAWHGLFTIAQQGDLALEFAIKYNDALLGIERENHGHAVLERVKREGEAHGYDYDHRKGGRLYFYTENRPGWSTNADTRGPLLSDLWTALDEGWIGIREELAVEEMTTFKKQGNRKYEADSGCTDDAVIKHAIAWRMRNVDVVEPGIETIDLTGAEARPEITEDSWRSEELSEFATAKIWGPRDSG